jgi:hypothetical protein
MHGRINLGHRLQALTLSYFPRRYNSSKTLPRILILVAAFFDLKNQICIDSYQVV